MEKATCTQNQLESNYAGSLPENERESLEVKAHLRVVPSSFRVEMSHGNNS